MKKTAVRALALILIIITVLNVGALAATGPAGYKEYTPEEYYEKLEYISDLIKEVCYYYEFGDNPIRLGVEFMAEVSPELYPSLAGAAKMTNNQLRAAVIAVLVRPEDFYALANFMLAYDRYMFYVEPDDYDRVYSSSTTFVGIGVLLENINGQNRISTVYQHSPAKTAGLMSGDVIVEVDGANVAGMTLDELAKLLKGPENSSVTLGIKREGAVEILRFTMNRTSVVVNSAFGQKLTNGAYLLTILRFDGYDTIIETIAALDEAKAAGADKLVIDLRDNHGGDMESLLNILNLFIKDSGVLMLTEEYRTGIANYHSTGTGRKFSKVVILINEYTASAAEVMAGTLQDLGIAQLVGVQSYGKGMAQFHIELDDLDYAVISISRLLLPKSGAYDIKGIAPDYKVENQYKPFPMPEMSALNSASPAHIGTVGDNVLAIEQRLSVLGYFDGQPNNSFDKDTLEAVNTMRARIGLEPTVLCGMISLAQLDAEIQLLSGMQVVDDLQMQRALEMVGATK